MAHNTGFEVTSREPPIERKSHISALTPAAGPVRRTRPRTTEPLDAAGLFTSLSRTVRESGLLRRARWFYAVLAVTLLVAVGGVVTGFTLFGESWFQLLMAAALGIIFTQAAFFAHEAAHRQVLESGPANDRLGRFVGAFVVGMSYDWWMTKHTRHHANPNRIGKDPDIEPDFVTFYPESAAQQKGLHAAAVRRQGWLFTPLLLLEGLNLHFQSLKHVFNFAQPVDHRWTEIGLFVLRFGLYFGVIFTFLPLGMAFAFIGVQMCVFGFYMGGSFAVNHIGMPVIARDEKLDFFSKQVRTSRNISGGFWASLAFGGLNYQVEHHLFPNMPRVHLSKARDFVRELCRTNDVPYTEMGIHRAFAGVVRHMHAVGLSANDPFTCHMLARYRRA